jgi:uncharacterized protein (DUF169 family)
MNAARQLTDLLGLRTAPVALTFQDTPPANISRIAAPAPSGCTYWKIAAEGKAFYTEASDHYNCPIGAFTHNVELSPERMEELQGVVNTMVNLSYIRPEEIPAIPQRKEKLKIAVYAPLSDAPAVPDVVIVSGNAKQMMLLVEAAGAAGAGAATGLTGRPTCAAIPAAIASGRAVSSLGCIGNRVYTDLADDELYCALPGSQLNAVVDKLAVIVNANDELAKYHRVRKAGA